MFLLDKLLTTPLLWIAREINEAVQKEKVGESEAITRSLSELYMRLEIGEITEQEFEVEESRLLDRLDAIDLQNKAEHGDADEPFQQSNRE
ncbi:MAG: gas vesicle protein GvpG [Candidatus Nitrotoga sp.]|nr:gas vesicle protein GvpG [Candidatus Nitrotoga sp.]